MSLTDEARAPAARHPAEGCVHLPVLLRDDQLAELDRKAGAEGRTIGQAIRLAIGRYLAGAEDGTGPECGRRESELDPPADGTGAVEITLLLPLSRLTELEARAARCGTTTAALIRRLACGPRPADA